MLDSEGKDVMDVFIVKAVEDISTVFPVTDQPPGSEEFHCWLIVDCCIPSSSQIEFTPRSPVPTKEDLQASGIAEHFENPLYRQSLPRAAMSTHPSSFPSFC